MYFDFEDYRPDIQPVGQAISWREGILLSIIFHLVMTLVIVTAPRWLPDYSSLARARAAKLIEARQAQQQREQAPRFVFVQPRIDRPAPKAPDRAELSDLNRESRSPEQSRKPTNEMPFSRGNSSERVEAQRRETARGQGPAPDAAMGQQARNQPQAGPPQPEPFARSNDSTSALQMPAQQPQARNGAQGRGMVSGGALGDALKNLQRYVQPDQFENEGGTGQFGPAIQFDTKGVEFGPWIRRFIAQIKRNWFIPYAAMSMKGHVVVTFNVHKDGSITDLQVAGASSVDAFNNAAYGALVASNPTTPLPPEYPSEHAFFTVTFFYNETPP